MSDTPKSAPKAQSRENSCEKSQNEYSLKNEQEFLEKLASEPNSKSILTQQKRIEECLKAIQSENVSMDQLRETKIGLTLQQFVNICGRSRSLSGMQKNALIILNKLKEDVIHSFFGEEECAMRNESSSGNRMEEDGESVSQKSAKSDDKSPQKVNDLKNESNKQQQQQQPEEEEAKVEVEVEAEGEAEAVAEAKEVEKAQDHNGKEEKEHKEQKEEDRVDAPAAIIQENNNHNHLSDEEVHKEPNNHVQQPQVAAPQQVSQPEPSPASLTNHKLAESVGVLPAAKHYIDVKEPALMIMICQELAKFLEQVSLPFQLIR